MVHKHIWSHTLWSLLYLPCYTFNMIVPWNVPMSAAALMPSQPRHLLTSRLSLSLLSLSISISFSFYLSFSLSLSLYLSLYLFLSLSVSLSLLLSLSTFFSLPPSLPLSFSFCFLGGELFELLNAGKNEGFVFREDRASQLMRDMISAVHYLHSKVVFFSDLTSYPILLYSPSLPSFVHLFLWIT